MTPRQEAPPLPPSDWPAPPKHRGRGKSRPSKRTRLRFLTLLVVHLAMIAHIAHWKITGSTVTPIEPSESMQTLELGYVNAGFVFFTLAILVTAIFGRFFCGWGCHVVAYQDGCAWILSKLGLKPRPVRSRLLCLIPVGVAIYMFVWPQISRWIDSQGFPVFQAHFSTDDFWQTFPGPVIAALTFLVDGFLLIYFLGSKGFCTHGCPYGAFFGLADKVAPGKILVNENCEQCGHCTDTCTSNVEVHREVAQFGMVVDSGCMKCLDCVSVCPKEALSFGFTNPWNAKTKLGKKPKKAEESKKTGKPKKSKVFDFTWGEEIVMALFFLVGLQYIFRLLYNKVSFFLAIGLSVLLSITVFILARLVKHSDFAFQGRRLKVGGRLTSKGWFIAGSLVLYGLFSAHSFFLQYHAREGERLLEQAGAQSTPAEPLLRRSANHLQTVARYALFSWGSVKNQLGEIARAQGNSEEAEKYYREAVEDDASLVAPRFRLSTLRYLKGDVEGAKKWLGEILEEEPQHPEALKRLDTLNRRHGEGVDTGPPKSR